MSKGDGLALSVNRRQLAPIYGAGFVTAFGAHAVAANLAGYTLGHHESLWQLGLLLGIYDGAEVLLKPLFGAVVDRKGAKPVMVGGLLAFAAASLLFVIGGDSHLLGVARLAQGAAAAAFSPAAGAALAALGGTKRTGRLFGGYGGAKGIGYLLGPLAGGALVLGGGYPLLFGVLAAIGGLAAMATSAWVPHIAPTPKARSTLVDLASQIRQPDFLRPVLLLGAATAALSTGVGFLPVLGLRHGLGPVATGALVSLLAATAAVLQPYTGRRIDAGRFNHRTTSASLLACAGGFAIAAALPGAAAIAVAALMIGAGVAVATPLGFTMLARSSPPDRMGRTMGAAEVGRELGDAGGPVLVGVVGSLSLAAGLGALAVALLVCAGLAVPRSPGASHGDDLIVWRLKGPAVNHFLETWGYLAIFVLTVLESAGVPIPSEITLGLGGALASGAVIAGTHGDLNLALVILVGTLGSVVGSLVAYTVGRTGGRALVDRFGRYLLVTPADVDRVEHWFRGRGEWSVLFGRVVPVVRTFISLPAGLAKMNVARFVALTAVGVAVWVTVLTSIGYALGTSWESITRALGPATYIVAALCAVTVVALVTHRVRAVRRRGESGRGDSPHRETR